MLIDNYNIPLLSAFLLGLLSAISPCTLAANIAAVAYVAKEIKTARNILLNGLFYTLGRGLSYTLLGVLIYFGVSSFSISRILEGWGSLALGPIMIIFGLVMFDVIKLKFNGQSKIFEDIKIWLSNKGYLGSLLLGMLLALAFCPYSGVLFFGILIPMTVESSEGFLLPTLFALGTGLPVMLFAFLIAFSMQRVSQVFNIMQKVEKAIRLIIALVFLAVGIYYSQFLIKFLLNLFIK
jgi:cytochrome c biogenesis protein CcdA